MDVGIVGYGAYVPRHRIKVEEIAKVWGADAPSYKRGLMLREKSVPTPDQDTITMSVEAARNALRRAGNVDPASIGAIYIGSESHPYAVKPSGTVVAEALGATPEIHCADLEFACKAGSEGMFVALSLVKAGQIDYALGIGADTSQGAPGDALEYSASAGAAAFIFGREKLLAVCEETYSYMTDTPDFWRREYQFYPRHAGRFTGEPAYFKHILGCAHGIMEKSGTKPEDFRWAVFHQPNGKFPMRAAAELGFPKEQGGAGLALPDPRQHLLRLVADGAHGHPRCREAGRPHPDGELRLGLRERRLHLAGYRSHHRSADARPADAGAARGPSDLRRLRDLRQVPRQDQEARRGLEREIDHA